MQICAEECYCLGTTMMCHRQLRDDLIYPTIQGVFLTNQRISYGIADNFPNLIVITMQDITFAAYMNIKYFSHLTHLRVMSLINIILAYIPPHMFSGSSKLNILDLHNCSIPVIYGSAFDGLHSLLKLNLSRVGLRVIYRRAFNKMQSVKVIDISGNAITDILDNVLLISHGHLTIYISQNPIKTIKDHILQLTIIHTSDAQYCCLLYRRYSDISNNCIIDNDTDNAMICDLLLEGGVLQTVHIVLPCLFIIFNCITWACSYDKVRNKRQNTLLISILCCDSCFICYTFTLWLSNWIIGEGFPLQSDYYFTSSSATVLRISLYSYVIMSKITYACITGNYVLITKYRMTLSLVSHRKIIVILGVLWAAIQMLLSSTVNSFNLLGLLVINSKMAADTLSWSIHFFLLIVLCLMTVGIYCNCYIMRSAVIDSAKTVNRDCGTSVRKLTRRLSLICITNTISTLCFSILVVLLLTNLSIPSSHIAYVILCVQSCTSWITPMQI